ncbi:uncharacterized protein VTP21DRAFT_11412 [Calcarisporiella thermophila]|uniref:uncharacterized protein n=1 Tax=Calcarisporiella thermophila TaxID=911321 RepID=UPI003741FF3E
MPKCTHRGCEQEFSESENSDTACQYHPLPPIFHEGLKGWQCCSKRVTDFDDFLKIPGCTTGRHSTAPVPAPTPAPSKPAHESAPKHSHIENGVEHYGLPVTPPPPAMRSTPVPFPPATPPPNEVTKESIIEVEEEDDLSIPVPPGTTCKHKGCGVQYKDDATSRFEGGEEATCIYHPGVPVFHEGSKGWSCCSRRVLEFDEFLKIKGCKIGKHLFVGSGKKDDEKKEELVDCRHDWYQTQTHIIMSVFAKKVNKNDSNITIHQQSIEMDLKMADGKRYHKTIILFEPIDPEQSKYEVLTTKVELKLKKTSGISWPSLEPTENITSYTTFGLTGTSGTVGGKEMHIAGDVPIYALKK